MSTPEPRAAVPQLSYATEPPRASARVWAAVAILLAGLGLVALGGCFLVGILAMYARSSAYGRQAPLGTGNQIFILILYILAFACFGGAVAVIITGLRALLRVIHESAASS